MASLKNPVNMEDISIELRWKKNRKIFERIYKQSLEQNWTRFFYVYKYDYVNPYEFQNFEFADRPGSITLIAEHVFVCLMRHRLTRDIRLHYVSKEYNVIVGGNASAVYNAGRFVFEADESSRVRLIALAEEPAKVYVSADFNIERYYIEIRKVRERGKNFSYGVIYVVLDWVYLD